MKRTISVILVALLLLGALPAFAAESPVGDELAKVVALVKPQLGIGDEYTDFSGELVEDETGSYWSMRWSADDGSYLFVDATSQGKVLSYQRSQESERYGGDFAPTLPKLNRADAQKLAESFLKKVLAAGESIQISQDGFRAANSKNHYFSGTILVNGLPSPFGFNLRVSSDLQAVASFNRDNGRYLGGIPSAAPATTKEAAEKLLKEAMKFRLIYVAAEEDGSPTDHAVLRYEPLYGGNYLVDAQTGKLIDVEDLYDGLEKGGETNTSAPQESAADSAGETKLSQAELEGIEKLDGVLDRTQLDAAARKLAELGLAGLSLSEANYRYSKEDDTYTCRLTYFQESGNLITRKYLNMDAKTGELLSLSTSRSGRNDTKIPQNVTGSAAQSKAEAFLAKYYADTYGKMKLLDSGENQYTFAQQENGYFFPENFYTVAVSPVDGSIDQLYGEYRDVTFDAAENLITEEAARSAYYGEFETTLCYRAIPKKLDPTDPIEAALVKVGYTYLHELRLAYDARTETSPYAVDAKTGKVLKRSVSEAAYGLQYTDVTSGKEILALAQQGIGFTGGTFQKSKALTQLDMVALLVSADGYRYVPGDESAADQLYDVAYSLGILKRGARSDQKQITRLELVKTLLDMSGYGKAAKLTGIYTCSFTDAKSIPAADLGYAAIAQGLKMVNGDEQKRFLPNAIATREQAAIMLYNFMNR